MKNLKLYAIVDSLSENILSIFSSVSEDYAVKQYIDALDKNKDKIYDLNHVFLFCLGVSYSVPESYEEVVKLKSSFALYQGRNIFSAESEVSCPHYVLNPDFVSED